LGSLRFRYINRYRLDGKDPSIRASGLTVLDFSMVKPIRRWMDFNFSVDNLTDKVFYETQNTTNPGAILGVRPCRIHATPDTPSDNGGTDIPSVG
jgi:hypothetical protein